MPSKLHPATTPSLEWGQSQKPVSCGWCPAGTCTLSAPRIRWLASWALDCWRRTHSVWHHCWTMCRSTLTTRYWTDWASRGTACGASGPSARIWPQRHPAACTLATAHWPGHSAWSTASLRSPCCQSTRISTAGPRPRWTSYCWVCACAGCDLRRSRSR